MLSAAFEIGANDAELQALAGLGALSARAGGALLADAAPSLFGCNSAAQLADPKALSEHVPSPLWQALRESPLASRIGLVFPRTLARPRYGKKADPIESFAFEELASNGLATEQRLWSSGAFAVAELVGRGFREHGWGYFGERRANARRLAERHL
ncbi:MAG: type VI secretion system contractile sheath large subunit [Polyangiaceae bacterium]